MEVKGVNIIDPPLFGPYSIHIVPFGRFEKGRHGNYRLKIFSGDDAVGYLLLSPLKWKLAPPSHAKEIMEWAQINMDKIMDNFKKIENGQKPTKIKVTATIQTKAIDVWVDKTTMDLFVKFADGKTKKINMLDALKGLENTWAGEILNPDMFDKVIVKNGMPTWPNEFDFDTDVIYDLGIDVSKKIAGNIKK